MLRKHLLVVGLVVVAAACMKKPGEEPVAKVNGEVITKKEFDEQVERNMARYRGQSQQLPPGIEQRIQESVLRRMIDDKIVEQTAKEKKITVSDDEVNAKFTEHKGRFRTEQAFADYLKRSNNTEANMKDDLKRNLLRDRVVEQLSGTIDVSDDDVSKYYTENAQRFNEKEQIRASRVVVRVAANATPADKKAALKEARRFYGLVTKKGADFAAIAKDSTGPEASRGGELGWFSRGRMPPDFDDIAFKLDAGKMSPVMETKLGYEIIKVDEKKPEHQRPLDEVKESIKNSLLTRKRNEMRRDVLTKLKEKAKVEQIWKPEQTAPMPPVGQPAPGPAQGAAEAAPAPAAEAQGAAPQPTQPTQAQ